MRHSITLVPLLLLVGCGGSKGTHDLAPGPTDFAHQPDQSPSGDAGGCADFDFSGAPTISPGYQPSAPPSADTGGVIADGTYYLTSTTMYDAPDASYPAVTTRQALRFASGTVSAEVYLDQASFVTNSAWAGTYATSGATLSITATCGTPPSGSTTYTASGTTLSLTESGTTVNVYTKQQ